MIFSAQGLQCGYHDHVVVHPQDFLLRAGDALALLGPNGSGKSTLLKTLTGLLTPIAGNVALSGLEPDLTEGHKGKDTILYEAKAKSPPREWPKHIAFVPQEEAIAFPFTVRQVVMMGRLPHSPGFVDTVEDHQIVEGAMARADCLEYADRPITELSGGEKQRAYIARALAQLTGEDPRVLLLDEPSTHLDFKHQAILVRLIRELREAGFIVIAAWHDLQLSLASCNQALLLVDGAARYQGESGRLNDPAILANAFETEFAETSGPRLKL